MATIMSAAANALVIRLMSHDDLDAVHHIECRAYAYPWTETIFVDCLRVGYRCQVLCLDNDIIGYVITHYVLDECHLLNICIAPEHQGQGYAKVLLSFVIDEARQVGTRSMLLEVRSSNTIACSLYETLGFKQVGVRPNYYPNGNQREDALLYTLLITE